MRPSTTGYCPIWSVAGNRTPLSTMHRHKICLTLKIIEYPSRAWCGKDSNLAAPFGNYVINHAQTPFCVTTHLPLPPLRRISINYYRIVTLTGVDGRGVEPPCSGCQRARPSHPPPLSRFSRLPSRVRPLGNRTPPMSETKKSIYHKYYHHRANLRDHVRGRRPYIVNTQSTSSTLTCLLPPLDSGATPTPTSYCFALASWTIFADYRNGGPKLKPTSLNTAVYL